MSIDFFRQILVHTSRLTLALQQPDGRLDSPHGWYMSPLIWAHCWAGDWRDNPLRGDARLIDAIARLGDYQERQYRGRGDISGEGFHVTRLYVWLRASEIAASALGEECLKRWGEKFVDSGLHVLDIVPDLSTFDGAVPNSVTWSYAYLHAVGKKYNVPRYVEAADTALDRILAYQTVEGCFREWHTPVTGYNMLSANAVEAYHRTSGNPRALTALERSWRWHYDYLLPDCTMPPTLDTRQKYNQIHGIENGHWVNQPHGRWLAQRQWNKTLKALEAGRLDSIWPTGLMSLQFEFYRDDVAPAEPVWPEYTRMTTEQVCIRRRQGWAAVLSGMTTLPTSNSSLRRYSLERQDCLSLAHKRTGLLIGSSHSMVDERFSSFIYYENGAIHYLPNHAYLKSTPPHDTLLLRYGSNTGALTVELPDDSADASEAQITFSMHWEKGAQPTRTPSLPLTAMAVKAHLPLRLVDGQGVTLRGNTVVLGEAPIELEIGPGETADFGGWSITSSDGPWTLRWPVWTMDPYVLFGKGEKFGLAEAVCFTDGGGVTPRPTATFVVKIAL
ncbi:MAG: hypothetical protein NTW19_02975 [Planctomycetota bacterium]|nr:hypothetical protein [Planctomycetota bacterium]